MWVELIGLPGVGKTTIIENEINDIKHRFDVVKSTKRNLMQRIYGKYLYVFQYADLSDDEALRRQLSYRHSFRLFKWRSQRVFFYDSGMLQVLLEHFISLDAADHAHFSKLVARIKFSQKIIFVKDDIVRIIDREYTRQERRFDFDKRELKRRYQDAERFIELVILPHINGCELITLESKDEHPKLNDVLPG